MTIQNKGNTKEWTSKHEENANAIENKWKGNA